MSFLNNVFIKLFCKKVGSDEFGNSYYESKKSNYLNQKKRYVVYNGLAEPSKVPPLWHGWLHYLSDELPAPNAKKYEWQKPYLPNLTGTKFAYVPEKKNKQSYEGWNPNL